MTKRLTALLCLIAIGASAQLPIHQNSVTSDVTKIKGNFDSFNWKWLGVNSQSNSFFIKNGSTWVDLDGLNIGYKMSKNTRAGQVSYVSSTNVTISDSNVYFSVANTNIPADGTYLFEVYAWSGVSTSTSATLAQGKIKVNQSLYEDNDGTFPWPDTGANLTSYTLKSDFNGHTGLTSTAHGGIITSVTAGTGLSGGGTIGSVTVALDVAYTESLISNNIAVAANTLKVTYPTADSDKLAGIAVGSTSNSTDAVLLARANHTGTQLGSTISDLETLISNNLAVAANTLKVGYTEALVNANVSVASNTAKVSYSDYGNVILKDGTVLWTGDENGGGNNSTNWGKVSATNFTLGLLEFSSSGIVLDEYGFSSFDFDTRAGYDTFGDISYDWNTRKLYGNWKLTNGNFNMSDGYVTNVATASVSSSNTLAATTEWVQDEAANQGWGDWVTATGIVYDASVAYTDSTTGTVYDAGVAYTDAATNGLASVTYVDAAIDSATATPYVITPALTVTVSRANGWMQSYYVTNPVTTINIGVGGTTGVDQVNLSVWGGTNSVTIATSIVTFATAPTYPTNDAMTILYYSEMWETNWIGSEL